MEPETVTAPGSPESAEKSVHEVVLDLLDADADLDGAAKDAVLEALTEVIGSDPAVDDHHTGAVFLTSISVTGFRGVGPQSRLDLFPAPGLMVVSGRNGSGKSSFAEALELALTGTSYRWLEKAKLWEESWRNLHQPDPCEIRIGLTRQGSGPLTVGMRWASGDSLSHRTSWTQVGNGKHVEGTDALGWSRPLELYRPLLSYEELGRLFDGGPSGLYDALAKVLGLEVLTDTEKCLAARLKETKAARDGADGERKRIAALLNQNGDERAQRAAALLRPKKVDIDAVSALATGAGGAGLTVMARLQRLASLRTAAVDDIDAATRRLREAASAVQATTSSLVDLTEQRVSVLQSALRFFERAGDSDCPVCGQGQLDAGWAQRARDTVATSEAALAEHRAAVRAQQAARAEAMGLLDAVESLTGIDGVELPALAAYNDAVSALGPVPDDDTALADHLESALTNVAAAGEALRGQAVAELAHREDAWRPLAAQLAAWVQLEMQARDHDAATATLNGAKKWVGEHTARFRNLRIEPIAAQARWIWEQLRQESNVGLGDITLQGSATRRRAVIEGTVDGQPTKALTVMSQGELHAVALALFLPRATASASPFRFVVLDDPIQAMDPAKIDGFVAVLTEVAKTHQVVVFSHDDRLASMIRETGLDARLVEVVREAGSKVVARDSVNPALRQVADVFALVKDDRMPEEVKRRAAPGLFRLAVEAAAKQSYFTRQSLTGVPRSEWEKTWQDTRKTRNRVALAVAGDGQADITSWVEASLARKRTLKICTAGVHGSDDPVTLYDARDLEKTVQDVLALK
jgi:recombinational DNA repair ATPase RecF